MQGSRGPRRASVPAFTSDVPLGLVGRGLTWLPWWRGARGRERGGALGVSEDVDREMAGDGAHDLDGTVGAEPELRGAEDGGWDER